MEPQWRRLVFQFREHLQWKYCLAGLIPDWNNFVDDANSVVRPAQLGPLWMQAKHASGMPMDPAVWHRSPIRSSFPACIAVKCAFLQSDIYGERYLRMAREAVMVQGKDVSSNEVLMSIASELSGEMPAFNVTRFISDYNDGEGRDAFRKDWMEARARGIQRFPTLLFSGSNGESALISGYNAFSLLRSVLIRVAPHLAEIQTEGSLDDYRVYWGSVTAREEEEFNEEWAERVKS